MAKYTREQAHQDLQRLLKCTALPDGGACARLLDAVEEGKVCAFSSYQFGPVLSWHAGAFYDPSYCRRINSLADDVVEQARSLGGEA